MQSHVTKCYEESEQKRLKNKVRQTSAMSVFFPILSFCSINLNKMLGKTMHCYVWLLGKLITNISVFG